MKNSLVSATGLALAAGISTTPLLAVVNIDYALVGNGRQCE